MTRPLVRIRPVLVSLGVICSVTACVPLAGGYAVSQKPVGAKEGDSALVANDGTRCLVLPRPFADVNIGSDHTCAWHQRPAVGRAGARGRDPTATRRTPPPPPGG